MPTNAQKFTVILQAEPDGGYSVHCPALPGCVSQGDDRMSALENIRQAIVQTLLVLAEKPFSGPLEAPVSPMQVPLPPYQDSPDLLAEELRHILKGRDLDGLPFSGVSLEQIELPHLPRP